MDITERTKPYISAISWQIKEGCTEMGGMENENQ
jgi:hypothetical protein